jgi:soluble lytic murein transglycosylase-like protein
MVRLNLPEAPDVTLDLRNLRVGLSCIGFSIPGSVTPHTADRESQPEPRRPIDAHALIRAAAKKHRVPAAFVKSIVAAESNFNCDAVSPKGAIGLMQLMPATAQEYGADPNIPEQNVDAGTHYLRTLMDKYGNHRNSLKHVIAAYNAGPGRVDRYRGVPPFRETRAYVVRVLSLLRRYEKDRG